MNKFASKLFKKPKPKVEEEKEKEEEERRKTIFNTRVNDSQNIYLKIYINHAKITGRFPSRMWDRLVTMLTTFTDSEGRHNVYVQNRDMRDSFDSLHAIISQFLLKPAYIQRAYENADMVLFYGQYVLDEESGNNIFNILSICSLNFGKENGLVHIEMLATPTGITNSGGEIVSVSAIGTRLMTFATYYIPFAMCICVNSRQISTLNDVCRAFGFGAPVSKISTLHSVPKAVTLYLSLNYELNHTQHSAPLEKTLTSRKHGAPGSLRGPTTLYDIAISEPGKVENLILENVPANEATNSALLQSLDGTVIKPLFNMELSGEVFMEVLSEKGYIDGVGKINKEYRELFRSVMIVNLSEASLAGDGIIKYALAKTLGFGRLSKKNKKGKKRNVKTRKK